MARNPYNRYGEHYKNFHREDDFYLFNISNRKPVSRDLGDGDDTVAVTAREGVAQVRLTFTSSEVGNGNPRDSNTMANQDGGLAVRVQAENAAGDLFGPVSRFDDEGITFRSFGRFTFDVRDLVSGAQRGDQFDVVKLGTKGNDRLTADSEREAYYFNAGMGDDRVTGAVQNDFLVGGAGNDTLSGRQGNDTFIGGGGNDVIMGGTGNDTAIFNAATDGSDRVDLGTGLDTVNVSAPVTATQVRLTFTSSEVGNDAARDSNTMVNQDGGLAVRFQLEDGSGGLTGLVSRYDDEGISFVSTVPGVTFDVRDLVSGVQRGDQFDVVRLGTKGNDSFDESGKGAAYYINAGMGDDTVIGGTRNDFLVGGAGNDTLSGLGGDDSYIGGAGSDVFVFAANPGNDTIIDFVSGTDKIDLRAFSIGLDDITTAAAGANTVVSVDTNDDDVFDFSITLVNVAKPSDSDYLLA